MQTLAKLFGSEARVKIIRLFLFNPESVFGVEKIAGRIDISRRIADKELSIMQKALLIRRKPFPKSAKGKDGKRERGNGWVLNRNFPYLRSLENLLIQQVLISESEIIKRLSHVAKLKLVMISGIFIQNYESRVDLLLVGDNLKKGMLDRAIKSFEAEIGKEVKFTAFETPEFEYRVRMYDRLIRDIVDYPHKTIIDKLGLAL